MAIERELIERVVADVMQQLASPTGPLRSQPTPVAELALTDNVLTEQTLAERIGSSTRIVVGPKTILTPSAHDFLRRQEIAWRRADESAGTLPTGADWLAIVLNNTSAVEAALQQLQAMATQRWSRALVGSPQEAAEQTVSAICRGEVNGVLVFAQPAAAIACRCNRNAQVRAATAADGGEVDLVSQQFGANVICVAPDGKSAFQLKNLARAFAAAGRLSRVAGWIDA